MYYNTATGDYSSPALFSVRSYAGGELIGKGIHKRCIINSERFMAKALSKLDNK